MADILIVDDSLVMRKKIRAMLTQAGHNIVGEADNGLHAFNEYKLRLPDIVTMDITMPNMDGIEAVKKIITSFPDAQIIMLSGEGQKAMVLDAIKNGAKNYIVKPIDEKKFLQVVNMVYAEAKISEKRNTPATKNGNNSLASITENKIDTKNKAFDIENKNGYFIINISKSVDESISQSLNVAIQGLLFIKPLNVIVNFNDIGFIKEEILKEIFSTLLCITDSGGTLRIISQNEKFVNVVSLKYFCFIVESYSDINEIIK